MTYIYHGFNRNCVNVNFVVESAHIFGKSERDECAKREIDFALLSLSLSLVSVITHKRDIDRGNISDRSCHLARCQASFCVPVCVRMRVSRVACIYV